MTNVPERLRRTVQERAQGKCEYCLIHEDFTLLSHEPDHIIAEKHGCATVAENLAWSCTQCNRFKGSDVGSFDLVSQKFVPLFNPRTQQWKRHLKLDGPYIHPLTASGRITVTLLKRNDIHRIDERTPFVETGHYP